MDYSEACRVIVTREEARREVERHGESWEEFVAENGDHKTYSGRIVLDWLGW
jgi:hypothetical protein